jgi:hypothetical protein
MKKFIVFLFVLIVLFLGTISAFSDTNPCLKLIYGSQGFNPDSIMIDTCKNSPDFQRSFMRGTWTIGFTKYFFKDSMNLNDTFYIENIDSLTYPDIFINFKIMQDGLGKLSFKRATDIVNFDNDYAFYKLPCFNIYIDGFNRVYDINKFIRSIPSYRLKWQTNYPKVNINRSCLDLLWGGKGENPDLIAEDTCKDSPTYGDRYQRGTWTIGFTKFIFKDSIPDGYGAYLKDIDTVNYYDYYLMFNKITQEFGEFLLHRQSDVCNNRWDEGFYPKPCMTIHFNKRFRTDDIEYYLYNLPEYRFIQWTNPPFLSDVIEENQEECIQINEKNEILRIKLNCESLAQSNDISIFNILGEHIDRLSDQLNSNSSIGNEINIDISYLPTGIYFLKIGNKILKFLKI